MRNLNRVTSCLLLLLFSSDLSTRVSNLNSDLLSTFDNISTFLNNKGCTLELTLWAISAQKVRLFIKRTSRSLALCTTNFLRPLGRKYLVVLSDPYPILGIFLLPLNLLRMRLSMPEWFKSYLLVFSSFQRVFHRKGQIGSVWIWEFFSWRFSFWGEGLISP